MDLGHRHRNAACKPGDDQQRLQCTARQPQRFRRTLLRDDGSTGSVRDRRLLPQQERQRHHCRRAEDRDAGVRLPPTGGANEMLDDWRPDGARQVIAACKDRDRDAAAADEPQRGVRKQRGERRGAAGADQRPLRKRVIAERWCGACGNVAKGEQQRAEHDRRHHAVTIGQPAHHDARQAEADHRQRVRQRCIGACDAELRLYRRQCHDDRPHADATDRRKRQRDGQTHPRGRRFDFTVRHGERILHARRRTARNGRSSASGR